MSDFDQDEAFTEKLDAQLSRHRKRVSLHKEWISQMGDTPSFVAEQSSEVFEEDGVSFPSRAVKGSDSILSLGGISSFTSNLTTDDEGWSSSQTKNKLKKKIKHAKPIEDNLIEKGGKYGEYLYQIRDAYMRDSDATFHPETSPKSKHPSKSQTWLFERFDDDSRQRQKRKSNDMKEESESLSYKPTVPKKNQIGSRSDVFKITEVWSENKEEKLKQLREDKEVHRKEVRISPKLNPRTLKLVNSLRQRKKDEFTEDYLEEKKIKRQTSTNQAEGDLHSHSITTFTKITPQAAALIREGSVSDRLYEQSFLLSEKKRQQSLKQLQELQEQIRQIQMIPNNSTKEHSMHGTLLKKNQESKEQKQQIVSLLLEKERELHYPIINSVSEEIASRLPQTPMERLLSGHMSNKTQLQLDGSTFKPYINPKSVEIEKLRRGLPDFTSRINQWELQEKRRREKLKSIKNALEQKELQDCTFSPAVSISPSQKVTNKSFDDRNKQWQRRRQIKLGREKAAVMRKEMDECSFRPAMSPRNASPLNITRSEETNTRELVGFEEFVSRHRSARDKKREDPPGSNWKNQLTKPIGPQLGKRTRDKIKALDRPVTQPLPYSPQSRPNSPRSNESRSSSPVLTPRNASCDMERRSCSAISSSNSTKYDVEDDDEQESTVDFNNFPRQGLFSSRSTVNILEELRYNFIVSEPPVEDLRNTHAREEEEEDSNASEEWKKRSSSKDR